MGHEAQPIQAVIDLGSARSRVLVLQRNELQPMKVIACSVVNTPAMKHGVITDLTATSQALRHAIEEVEKQSGMEIRGVDAAIGGEQVVGINSQALRTIASGTVGREDVLALSRQARKKVIDDNYRLLHVLEEQFVVDEYDDIHEPVGMMADKMEGYFHILRAKKNVAQNLQRCIEATGVEIDALVFSGLASGYAATTAQERELGVCVLDIGAGTTDFMVWRNGYPALSGGLNLGGEEVSSCLASTYSTTRQYAEMLKCQQGAMNTSMLKSNTVALPSTGLRPSREINGEELVEVINKAYLEIFSKFGSMLHNLGMREMSQGGMVLTGGAAQIAGLAGYAEETFELPVRIAKPIEIQGLPDHLQYDASMMTVMGMLKLFYEPLNDHIWESESKQSIMSKFMRLFN